MDPNPPHSTTPHTQQHPQHTDPPQARASMSGGATGVPSPVPPSLETQVLPAEPESPTAPRRRRSSTILVPVLGLLAVALIGLSTWWYMSRQGGIGVDDPPFNTPEARPTSVPVNAVALINSSTPIPLVAPHTAGNSTVDLASEPDSTGWSQALREAHRAREEGRYSSAISQYSALVGAGASEEARDALWGLAGTYADAGQRDLAARTYSLFAGLDDPRAPAAYVRVGNLYEQMGRSTGAMEVYAKYAALGGPAAHAVRLMHARLLGNTAEAEKLYQQVLDGKPLEPDRRPALLGLGQVKANRGDHAGARKVYEQLAALQASDPRPVLDNTGRSPVALAADEAQELNDKAGAVNSLLEHVRKEGNYPFGRYSALETLVKIEPTVVASGTVPPMLAARIAFDAGYYGKAIEYMDLLRTGFPESPERATAALLTGRAFDRAGDPASAFNWYTATVQSYPTSPEAPEALRRAGDALEEQALWDDALGAYKQLIAQYPNATAEIALARVHGAVLAYRLEDRETAANFVGPIAGSDEVSPTVRSQAIFWLGKLQKAAGDTSWRSTLEQVARYAPGTFLDFRARDLLAGEADGGPLALKFTQSKAESVPFGVDYDREAAERDALLDWAEALTGTQQISSTSTVMGTRTTVAPTPSGGDTSVGQDPETARAATLLYLGFEDEAYTAFRALAERLQREGRTADLARVVLYLRYHADTFISMVMADRLAGMDTRNPLDRPALLQKTQYPTPYRDLVLGESKSQDMDPLLMYALIRQESQFVPDARSHADARGLTQVIPSTGEGIAAQLNDSGYSLQDLYLPHVSIRYGAYYLGSNLPQFDRKVLPALAAYNGGPGNAARWLQGSALIDPDLFAERIDLFETEDYLERVYQNYGFYRRIYAPQ